jgi:hypothetical protein
MNKVKPEATYFMPIDGHRSMAFIVNIQSNDQVPALVWPLFQRMDVKVDLIPRICTFIDDKLGYFFL